MIRFFPIIASKCSDHLNGVSRFYFNAEQSRVKWKESIKSILVVHKFCDLNVIESLKSFVHYVLKVRPQTFVPIR